MKKNKNNEELQSRREFFKKAAKGALPILGAIVLANSPILAQATEESPMGCRYEPCVGGCHNGCRGGCRDICTSCHNGCTSGCKDICTGCHNGCSGSCKGYSK